MRNKQLLIKEIVEANALKSAYSYYLASERARNEVENTTQVKQNLYKVSATLRQLYSEFEDLNFKRLKDERGETIDKPVSYSEWPGSSRPELETPNPKQHAHLQTEKAIMLFNTDVRFSITE